MAKGTGSDRGDIVGRRLLEESGIFDRQVQRAASSRPVSPELPASGDPIPDYLHGGWRDGIEPNRALACGWLYPYYASAGLTDPPALTYLALRAARYPVYPSRAAAERVAKVVRASGLFDAPQYAAATGIAADLDPALHYVVIGERLGFVPSDRFDPEYYGKRYPDLLQARDCLLAHYVTDGRNEGRRPVSIAAELQLDARSIDPERQTVLVVAHEATRTGAPILAYNIAKRLHEKYNIVLL